MFIRTGNTNFINTKKHGKIEPDALISLWLYFRLFTNIAEKNKSFFEFLDQEWVKKTHPILSKLNEFAIHENTLWELAEIYDSGNEITDEDLARAEELKNSLFLNPIDTEYKYASNIGPTFKLFLLDIHENSSVAELIKRKSELEDEMDIVNNLIVNSSVSNVLRTNIPSQNNAIKSENIFDTDLFNKFFNTESISESKRKVAIDIIISFIENDYLTQKGNPKQFFLKKTVPPQIILNILKFLIHFNLTKKELFKDSTICVHQRNAFYNIFRVKYSPQTYLKVHRNFSQIQGKYDNKGYGLYDNKYCKTYFALFQNVLLEEGKSKF